MPGRVMLFGRWAPIEDAVRLLNHPGHSSQKSHGRKGEGGYQQGRDISASADYDEIYSSMVEPEIGSRPRHAPKVGDEALSQIQAAQGFDGKPPVVSREEFDRAVEAGEVAETFRGFHGAAAVAHAESFRSGELHPGEGIYGNGTYVATDRSQAEAFAGRFDGSQIDPGSSAGAMVRIGLRADAKVVSMTDLRAEMKTYTGSNSGRVARMDSLDKEMRRRAERTETIEDQIAVYNDFNRQKIRAAGSEYLVNQDEGRFAALRGYDAIDIPGGQGGDQMIILNRTATIVEEA